MSFVAEAERAYAPPPDAVWDRLADASSWRAWMPRSFRPTSTPDAPLGRGDRVRVRILHGPPATLTVTVADRGRALTWTGGTRGVLFAEHRFVFERRADGGTFVRSIETWSGGLAPLVRRLVQPLAVRIVRAQLEGLARALGG